MTTIIAGQPAQFTVTMQANGAPISIATSSAVTAQLFSLDGATALSPVKSPASTDPGADWANGVVAVSFIGSDTQNLMPPGAMLVVTAPGALLSVKRFSIDVETAGVPTKSSLFIKDFVVDELRADRLMLASANFFAGVTLTDDFLWEKVRAAESEIAHTLRVPLVPTKFFPLPPTTDQIAALGSMPWAEDPAYDYTPDMFYGEKWGFIVTRQKPLISIDLMRFAYPSQNDGFVDIPPEWIRIDKKYGHVRLVPSSPAVFTTMNAFIMTALAGMREVPFMIQLTYTAGLENAARDFPELLDIIKKAAVLKAIEDGFLPQSGSISADGLSQSMSLDMSKYHDTIDRTLNGPPGSNGGLMAKIHGIRTMVI